MNQVAVRSTMGEQLLRLLIFFLVAAQVVVIYQAVSLLSKTNDDHSYIPPANPWARQLADLNLPDGRLASEKLIAVGSTAQKLFHEGNLAAAEPLYVSVSNQLAERLGIDPQGDEPAVTSAMIRERSRRLLGESTNYYNMDAYYVEAQILTDLGEIERRNGNNDDARRNLARAAAIYRELQVKSADRIACLQGLKSTMEKCGQRGGAELIQDEISGISL